MRKLTLIRRKPAGAAELATAPAGAAADESVPLWRRIYQTPPDVRFDVGAYCPLSDHVLIQDAAGWRCEAPSCLAVWDFKGQRGRWEAVTR